MEQFEGIEQAAATGDVSAMTTLGKLALIGRAGPRTKEEGAGLLLAAADAGNPEAGCIASALMALLAEAPQDWSQALGYLKRAAQMDWRPAQEQLCLLATDRDLARAALSGGCDDTVWEQLRDSIDVPALLSRPAADAVSQSPRIAIFKGFADKAECSWLIERSRTRMGRAMVADYSGAELRPQTLSTRTNSARYIDLLDTDFIVAVLRARIARATGFPRQRLEFTNILHYAVGEQNMGHFDYFNPADGAAEIRANGQRVATFLIYLNEEYEGGETQFMALRWRYKGAPGDALFFMNVTEDGSADRRSGHAGLPPTSGEKWVLSQWIRGLPGVGL